MALTPRQKQLLDFITGYCREHQCNPSFQEIADALGLASLATVHKHIEALEKKQYVRRVAGHSRSVELTEKHLKEIERLGPRTSVPLLGTVAAGARVDTFEEQRDTLDFSDFSGSKDTFALRVKGDSMIEENILDGDYVLLERTHHAENGDVVVARVGERDYEATLKTFYREGDTVRLQPANSRLEPVVVAASDVKVEGRLLAVLRKFR